MKKTTKQIVTGLLVFTMLASTACANSAPTDNIAAVTTLSYTFELSNDVSRTTVTYPNRFGITLAADLYVPNDLDMSGEYPALVIGPPYGGVKEQGPGVYANQLAQRGFVVLAFDPSYNGNSEGNPRHVSSPDLFVEDFSAGVDYLGTLTYVDRENIGAIGICGSGGFAITAAQVDKRIKAVATTSMYDISRNIRNGFGDSMTAAELDELLTQLSQQRWHDFESGEPEAIFAFPIEADNAIPAGLDPISAEFYSYYGLERGHHPNARGGFTTTSMLSFINFPLLNDIETVSPRPILFIVGEHAHSRYFSEDAYQMAGEAKELYVVADANHVDLYDDIDKIPFDKLEAFFMEAFQNEH